MIREENSAWNRLRNGPFHRIGDTYSHFIDGDHFMGRSAFEKPWLTKPSANLKKTPKQYELEVALPGFKKEEVSIVVDHGWLTVKATKDVNYRDEYLKQEIDFDSLERSFQLAQDVDADRIDANFSDGILRIYLAHNGTSNVDSREIFIR